MAQVEEPQIKQDEETEILIYSDAHKVVFRSRPYRNTSSLLRDISMNDIRGVKAFSGVVHISRGSLGTDIGRGRPADDVPGNISVAKPPGDTPPRSDQKTALNALGAALERRAAMNPMWLFGRGMAITSTLIVAAAIVFSFSPWVGIVLFAASITCWGAVVVLDAAVRGSSFQDPRFGLLMLATGLGSFVLAIFVKLTPAS